LLQDAALHGLHHVEGTFEVGVEHGVPVFLAHAQEQAVFGDTGVVHEDVHMVEVGQDLLADLGAGRAVGHIDGVSLGGAGMRGVDGVGGALRVGLRAADDGDFRALGGEGFSDGFADAASGSGDDCDFVLKFTHAFIHERRSSACKKKVRPTRTTFMIVTC
jgi:hypothetical protein